MVGKRPHWSSATGIWQWITHWRPCRTRTARRELEGYEVVPHFLHLRGWYILFCVIDGCGRIEKLSGAFETCPTLLVVIRKSMYYGVLDQQGAKEIPTPCT